MFLVSCVFVCLFVTNVTGNSTDIVVKLREEIENGLKIDRVDFGTISNNWSKIQSTRPKILPQRRIY